MAQTETDLAAGVIYEITEFEKAPPSFSDAIVKSEDTTTIRPTIECTRIETGVLPEMTDADNDEIKVKNEPIIADDAIFAATADAALNDGIQEVEMAIANQPIIPLVIPEKRCNNSPKNRSDEDRLMRRHFNLNCEVCREKIDTMEDNIIHFRQKHKQKGYVRCCGYKIFTQSDALDHLQLVHNADRFRCELCDVAFDSMDELHNHEVASHSTAVGDTAVMNVNTSSIEISDSDDDDHISVVKVSVEDNVYKINDRTTAACKPAVVCSNGNKNHLIRRHFNLDCEICHSTFDTIRNSFRHYREVHNRKGYIRCCSKQLFTRGNVLHHLKLCHNVVLHRCEPCDEYFESLVELHTHKAASHVSKGTETAGSDNDAEAGGTSKVRILNRDTFDQIVREFCSLTCDLCTTKFRTIVHAQVHYRNEHDQRGYIKCCGRKLFLYTTAKEHLQRHLDCTIFRCMLCNKTFATTDALQFHNRHYHDGPPRDKFWHECLQCSEWFKNAYYMKKHVRLVHDTSQEPASSSETVATAIDVVMADDDAV